MPARLYVPSGFRHVLQPRQFLSVEEVGQMRSADQGGITMDEAYRATKEAASRGQYLAHGGEEFPHGPGSLEHKANLAAYVQEHGTIPGSMRIWDKDLVYDGHRRFYAAKDAGLTHVPVNFARPIPDVPLGDPRGTQLKPKKAS